MTGAPRIHQPTACDQALELVRDEQSAAIPLDPSAPVYRVVQATTGPDQVAREVKVERVRGRVVEMAFVSHFATCPKAAQFSGGKRRKVAV